MLTLLSALAATIALQAAPAADAPASPLEAKRTELMAFVQANAPQQTADREAARIKFDEFRVRQDEFKTKLMAGIDPSSLSLSELIQYRDLFPAAQGAAIDARVDAAAQGAGPEAIDALLAQRRTIGRSGPAAAADLMTRIFTNPALEVWVQQRGVVAFVQTFGRTPPELLGAHKDIIVAVANAFKPTIDGSQGIGNYMKMIVGMGDALTPEQREAMRTRLLDVAQQALVLARSANDDKAIERLERSVQMLDSNAIKGRLMNNEAPDIDFIWAADANGPVAITSLDELKGKVVVLDFWATWCGPCVGSFPKIKELRSHYSPDDVVVLGVTSLQGRHHPKGKPAIDCKDNPAREEELMTGYIKDMDMSWQVAFSKADVFNPAYEVDGIPHLAIIDAAGVLRHNGLHPSMPLAEKAKLIDALLVAQGKTPPAAPVVAAPAAPATAAGPAPAAPDASATK